MFIDHEFFPTSTEVELRKRIEIERKMRKKKRRKETQRGRKVEVGEVTHSLNLVTFREHSPDHFAVFT